MGKLIGTVEASCEAEPEQPCTEVDLLRSMREASAEAGEIRPECGPHEPAQLLALLATGMSRTEDLAETLFISQKTVKNHLASIYEKLAITDRAQAVVEAIRLGINR